jgi:hypothetical protein
MKFMEMAVRLYQRENRKQTREWVCAMHSILNKGTHMDNYKENNHRKIWEWGLNRWGMAFSYLECEIRQSEDT